MNPGAHVTRPVTRLPHSGTRDTSPVTRPLHPDARVTTYMTRTLHPNALVTTSVTRLLNPDTGWTILTIINDYPLLFLPWWFPFTGPLTLLTLLHAGRRLQHVL